jgi:hypothetical protein
MSLVALNFNVDSAALNCRAVSRSSPESLLTVYI